MQLRHERGEMEHVRVKGTAVRAGIHGYEKYAGIPIERDLPRSRHVTLLTIVPATDMR